MSRFLVIAAATVLVSLVNPISAMAEQGAPINVNANMARVLRINAPAATVIVGNPAVADVTIQDPQTLILTGKSYGQTNLIVLDAIGNPIADTLIEVVQKQAGTMTVYQGQQRSSLSCAPVCQPTIMLGDDPSFLANSISGSNLVSSAAN
ncbi:pilus assembly protein N-terminal domain-containing protein [Devosia rhodophyticola]|uniref:Pilus assembly protein N-terminal domain-containing protein n=1 Tax=Devosia rhodophyticola TaxID=3026423 RepID=A0ABY7Z0K2_9HYPH|nr:pilus assembly protein N-terminal domain-containing protein [Devosia rhodophyticola]WDR06775.1 pilus assembly protein N-terminal domain-containing protein [Devosia rhodophyticola]